jgi:alpha-L-rhamnosidase
MNLRASLGSFLLSVFFLTAAIGATPASLVPADFAKPPAAARPWVYAFWMEGNVTKEGITADLEAMARQGIGGFLFMDGALGNPNGPHRFMSDSWREMFKHMLAQADRLGLQVNLNNDPGWAGSGGPWVKPSQATQKVITSETLVQGPAHFTASLPQPTGVAQGYYQDIAVLAYPAPTAEGDKPFSRIPDFNSTKSFAGGRDFAGVVPWPRFIATGPNYPEIAADQCVSTAKMQDLTAQLGADGKLTWDVPPGKWLLLRIGHTVANGQLRSAQAEANGLESNKLSRAAMESHYAAMIGKLTADIGPLTGKALVSVHVDSWESGSGNWTEGFREEFRQRRGYDLLPFMPTLNGIVVDSLKKSERFLWDYRETITELLLENYAGHLGTLAHKQGLRFSIEAYDGTTDDLRYAGRADEPMSEFWQRPLYNGLPMCDLSEGMASAAHVYGRRIVGAEAFTTRWGDFLDHPAKLKLLADWAFCTGVNRLYFAEWVMQPWPRLTPGVSFLDLGTVFGRGQTWWDLSASWHEYIARCQNLLRQGQFVADICFMTPEGAPGRFIPPIPATSRGGIPSRPEYNFDGCPPELVLKEMKVADGRMILPSGMSYRLLVLPTYNADGQPVMHLMDDTSDYYYKPAPLPKVQTMTPTLLRRIKELVEAGATVLGTRPLASPSLSGYPECDTELTQLADELWGRDAGVAGQGERQVGKGRVVWGSTPEKILSGMNVPADFTCNPELKRKLNYIHRRTEDGTDFYFVVNQQDAPIRGTAFFRTAGRQPEWWSPQTGAMERAPVFEESNGVTQLPLHLEANESVFVVFREPVGKHLLAVTAGSESTPPAAVSLPSIADDSFTVAAWVKAGGEIPLPVEAADGWHYTDQNIAAAGAGFQVFSSAGQGRGGFAAGTNGVVIFQYGRSGQVEPLLAYATASAGGAAGAQSHSADPIMAAALSKRIHVGVVYKDRIPYLFLDGKLVKTGPTSRFPPGEGGGWADQKFSAGDVVALEHFDEILASSGHGDLARARPAPGALPAFDLTHGVIWKAGAYQLAASDGSRRDLLAALPPPQEITGPWEVAFDPKWGGPAKVNFNQLEDWVNRPEEGIKFYSGEATYRKTFKSEFNFKAPQLRIYLDLGQVAAMAEVKLNGKNLGVLWTPPYRVDVTDALNSAGDNTLEVKVVNLWVNRLIGDEHLPEDSPREPDGSMKSWPKWIEDGQSSPTGRYTFASRRIWTKDDPLIKSGLLGPVRLLATEKITMP